MYKKQPMFNRYAGILTCGLLLLGLILICCDRVKENPPIIRQTQMFTESAKELDNPNRGFYHLYRFAIDDTKTDYMDAVAEYCRYSRDTTLALVEINLQNYRESDISRTGMENINALLDAWAASGKQLIIRFLYDWDGENLLNEPESLDTVLRHAEQVGEILRQHESSIFTLQGLLVGNWGEMHNTKFSSADDLRLLARTLLHATGDSMYLSVRTPAQWRIITADGTDRQLAAHMGLFNDGLLASDTDLNTYDMDRENTEQRSRADELAFQNELCTGVPNGGEVTIDNTYNDFENAVQDLSAMHITYLNQDYDREVLNKWAATTVSGRGCFDGLDGLSYIRRHLGYRLLITQAVVSWDSFRQQADVTVSFQNVGFAPLYISPDLTLILRNKESDSIFSYPVEHNLCDLSGGQDTGEIGIAQASLPLKGLGKGVYGIYLDLKDPSSGQPILLANEQDRENDGYLLMTVTR